MDKFYHWLEEGFIQAGTFFISDKYTQGVDVEFIVDRKYIFLLINKVMYLK